MCPTKMWIASNKIKVSCLHVLHMLHMSFTKSRVILVTTSDFDLVWYLQIGEMASWNPTELSMLGVVSPSDVFWPPQMIMDTIPTNKWFKPCIFTGGRLMGSKFSQPFFWKIPKWLGLKWFPGLQMAKTLCVFFTVKMVVVFDPLYYSKVPQNQREEYWNIFWDLIQEKNLVANLRKEPSF